MSEYAWELGHSEVMHLTQYDRMGNLLKRTLCGRTFNRTCNLPLGRSTCKTCARIYAKEATK
ncbi:MAG: hypothetical protein WA125_04715 [Desulfosporosinus sp.]